MTFMLSDIFVDDHRQIDAHIASLLESMRSGKESSGELDSLRGALRRHIYFEETTLFPMAENENNRTRINGLEVEHAGIWQLVEKIQDYLDRGDMIRAIDRTEGLARLLETHVNAELDVIYRELDSSAGIDNKKLIEEFNRSEMPEGWVCRVLEKYKRK